MATALSKYNSPLKQKEGEKRPNGMHPQSKAVWKLVREEFFLSRIQCVSYTVLIHFVAPGGAGGAHSGRRIVCMQTGRHGHCMSLGIYGAADGSEDTVRLRSQGELPSVVFRPFLSSDVFFFLSFPLRRYELPGCHVPPKLWSALPPCSGVQGDVL